MGHVAIRAREASTFHNRIVRTRTTLADSTTATRIYTAICARHTTWSTGGVSACYTLDHGIISLCLSQKVKGQKRSAARETHIPLLCSDEGVVE